MNGGNLKNNYFVLTVKDYLHKSEQFRVEKEISDFINDIWVEYKIKCIFIPTGANPIEENDLPVGQRLRKRINNTNIFDIKLPVTPEETKKIIKKAKFTVCTRMHSAIFSITEFVPLIAIAYEHKSVGLLESLKLNNLYIKMSETTKTNLFNLSKKILQKKFGDKFIIHLRNERKRIINYRKRMISEIINFS